MAAVDEPWAEVVLASSGCASSREGALSCANCNGLGNFVTSPQPALRFEIDSARNNPAPKVMLIAREIIFISSFFRRGVFPRTPPGRSPRRRTGIAYENIFKGEWRG